MGNIIYMDPKFRETWFAKDLGKIIAKYVKPNDSILFYCAGRYRFKSIVPVECYYLDIDPSVLSDIDSDHKYLYDAFNPNTPEKIGRKFDVVVADPPYYVAYHKKVRFLKNLTELSRRTIIIKWNIIPRLGEGWNMVALYLYEGKRWWTYVSLITVFEKQLR